LSRVTARGTTADRACPTASACVIFGFLLLVNPALGQTPDILPHGRALKRLMLEQLELDVVFRVLEADRGAHGEIAWR
jgi:hypothetical protein